MKRINYVMRSGACPTICKIYYVLGDFIGDIRNPIIRTWWEQTRRSTFNGYIPAQRWFNSL